MADLDDFFAKKDKKKSKSVKKFATAEELTKKLEDTKKADKPIKKERTLPQGPEGEETGNNTHVCTLTISNWFCKIARVNGHIVDNPALFQSSCCKFVSFYFIMIWRLRF